jgi:hypothetical protein
MALFAAIGDRFISKILKQVAHDYKLDFEDMKSRYLGPESFEKQKDLQGETQIVDLEPEIEPATKPKSKPKKAAEPKPKKAAEPKKAVVAEPKEAAEPGAVIPLSKMKKADLVAELTTLGLDTDGSVALLKDRVKTAREAAGIKPKRGGGRKSSKVVKVVPKHNHVLTEEHDDTCELCESHGNVLNQKHSEQEYVNADTSLQDRLKAILAGETEDEEPEEADEEPDSPGGIRHKQRMEEEAEEDAETEILDQEDGDLAKRLRDILDDEEEEEEDAETDFWQGL